MQKGVGGEPDRAHAATAELAGETVSAGEEVVGPDSPSNTLLIGHVHRLVDDAAVCPQQRYYRLYLGLRHRLDELPSERLYWVRSKLCSNTSLPASVEHRCFGSIFHAVKGSDMSVSEAAAQASVPPDALDGLSLPERVALLRSRMAAVPSRGETASVRIENSAPVRPRPTDPESDPESDAVDGSEQVSVPTRRRPVLPVPSALMEVLPHGGLVRGTVASVSGAGSLLIGLVAAVTGAGGHVAVIGQPRFGLLAAVEMGAQLSKLALIPDPGPDPVEVAAILLDGVDLVVLGLGGLSVPPTRARAVVARARSKGSTLVVTDGHWDGAELRLDASVHGYDGLGTGRELGRGRLRGVRLSVCARGKAMRPRTVRFDLRAENGRIEWHAEQQESNPLSIAVST